MQTLNHTHQGKNGTSGHLHTLINEENNNWEKLPTAEQAAPNFLKYQNEGCELKKFGNFWYKKCPNGGTPVTTGTTETSGSTSWNFPNFKDFDWKEIASDTYETLKKAGKWVKTEAGKFYAYMNAQLSTVDAKDTLWDCINKYNQNWGYYKLLRGGGSLGDPFYYEYNNQEIDGQKTIFVYFGDNTFAIRFRNSTTNIPGQTGKWSCLEGGGYKLNFDDGREVVFGLNEKISETGGTNKQNSNSENTGGVSTACKTYSACPSFIDIVNKNLSYTKCMKCAEIEAYQKNPVLNVIYFRKLRENGLPEKTDENFGPILESAVKEYQEMNGIPKTGKIDAKTNKVLMRDSGGRQQ